MSQAYSYLRFSTAEQAKGDSFRRQIEAARTYAASRKLDLDESFRDEGISGFTGANRTRGALAAFLRAVEDGRVPRGSVLIIESLDRLSREQVRTALRQFLALIDEGIEIVTLQGGTPRVFSEDTLGGDSLPLPLIEALLTMSRAHEESALKAQRVAAAWATKKRDARATGKPLTSRVPGWITLDGGRYILDEEKGAVVKRIFAMSIAGHGADGIARTFNREGIQPFGRPDRRQGAGGWYPNSISKILSGPSARGDCQLYRKSGTGRVEDGDIIKGYFPAAVSKTTWDRAQAAIASRAGTGGPGAAKASNLFSGIAECSCGGRVVFVSKGITGGRFLMCDTRKRGGPCNASWTAQNYDDFEGAILAALPAYLRDVKSWMEVDEEEAEKDVDERASQVESQAKALLSEFAGDTPEMVALAIRDLMNEAEGNRQEAIRIRQEKARRRISQKLRMPVSLDTPEQRNQAKRFLRTYISRIRVGNEQALMVAYAIGPGITPMSIPVKLPPKRRGGWAVKRAREAASPV